MSGSNTILENVIIVSTTENSVESGTVNESIISEATAIHDVVHTEREFAIIRSDIGVYDSVIATTLCIVDPTFANMVDAPMVDAPMVDAPMVDAHMVDAPIVDAHMVDAPIVDPSISCAIDPTFATKGDESIIDPTSASMVDRTFATTFDRTIASTLIGVDQISSNDVSLKEKQNNDSPFLCCYGVTICFNYVTTFFNPCNAVTECFCTCCDCSQFSDCITNCCTCACCNDCNCDIEACLMCCCCCCCCQQ